MLIILFSAAASSIIKLITANGVEYHDQNNSSPKVCVEQAHMKVKVKYSVARADQLAIFNVVVNLSCLKISLGWCSNGPLLDYFGASFLCRSHSVLTGG